MCLKMRCKKMIAYRLLAFVLVTLFNVVPQASAQGVITLDQAILMATQNDLWLEASRFREQSTRANSVVAGQLPDPVIKMSIANLPLDSFELNQEPMSQLTVGFSQVFPRGDSRALKQRHLQELGAEHSIMRLERSEKLGVVVAHLWLENYRNREAIRLIEKDRALFEHLVDVAQSSYTSALGKTRQQDLIRAQLELTRLEDRLTVLQQREERARAQLSEWLPTIETVRLSIDSELPTLVLRHPGLIETRSVSEARLINWLQRHPSIRILDQKVKVGGTNVLIAQQQYKPQWGLSLGYGYRDDDPLGVERSDFFSFAVSFDVPLFTENRQDKIVQSAVATESATKTDRILALRSLRTSFEEAHVILKRLSERKILYRDRLLKEVHDQAEASLTAYTHNDGDFSEVIRARIAELNANIDYLNIRVDYLKTVAKINYFLPKTPEHASEGVRS